MLPSPPTQESRTQRTDRHLVTAYKVAPCDLKVQPRIATQKTRKPFGSPSKLPPVNPMMNPPKMKTSRRPQKALGEYRRLKGLHPKKFVVENYNWGLPVPTTKERCKICVPCLNLKGSTCRQKNETLCYGCQHNNACWQQQPCECWEEPKKARYWANFALQAYSHPSPTNRVDLIVRAPYRLDLDLEGGKMLKLRYQPGTKDVLGSPPPVLIPLGLKQKRPK